MRFLSLLLLICASVWAGVFSADSLAEDAQAARAVTILPSGEWGNISLFIPLEFKAKTNAVVVLFSTEGGVQAVDREAAERLRAQGHAVALVDTSALLTWARTGRTQDGQESDAITALGDGKSCMELASVGQWLSQTMQEAMNFPDYLPAVLIGRGAGAWVVHSLLAQAPEGVFKAGLSVGFVPGNPSGVALCGVDAVGPDQHISPDTALHGRWSVADERSLSFDAARYARQATAAGKQLQPEFLSARPYSVLVGDFMVQVGRESAKSGLSVHSLPLIELVPNAVGDATRLGSDDVLVVFFSGDGGWRDIDQQVGRELALAGYHVLGIDALRYFWRKRTPDGVATDITDAIKQARVAHEHMAGGGLRKLVLIGYSFGANILPFVYSSLPEALRQQVSLVVLLSPELRTDFKIHLSGWLGAKAGEDAEPILPAARMIPQQRLLCVQGIDEGGESLCSQPALAQAEILRLPGGHHYDEDYPALAMKIMDALRRRLDREHQ